MCVYVALTRETRLRKEAENERAFLEDRLQTEHVTNTQLETQRARLQEELKV